MPINSPTLPESDMRYLRWIAGLNLAKGLILLGLTVGLLKFLHKDVDTIVGNWMTLLRMDLENRHIAALLERLDLVTDGQLWRMSGLTFLYAGLFLTEGTGLLLKQTWAKYFTIVVTSSFVPLELFETARHFGFAILAVLLTNLAIVWFLVANLRRTRQGSLAGHA
ncbi:MAG: DUF2127 domain-containing protein [Chthoniobacteraceae bacterium]